jgi:hypothetical protein
VVTPPASADGVEPGSSPCRAARPLLHAYGDPDTHEDADRDADARLRDER